MHGDDWFDELYRTHHVRLVRLAYLMTSDEGLAEEIAQESFVRVWRASSRIRDPEAVGAYLRATAVNLARSGLRRRALELRHRVRPLERLVEVDPSSRLDALALMRRLPPRQRMCVALRFYEDLTAEQTADLLGISVGTVKSQTHKALRTLQELIGGDDDGP